ncbi:MAG TPA: hypothetical protein VMR41_04565 [Patescibacteria group bacterium]|nr:hypothetical protein [Patescibacteria group bacterium]
MALQSIERKIPLPTEHQVDPVVSFYTRLNSIKGSVTPEIFQRLTDPLRRFQALQRDGTAPNLKQTDFDNMVTFSIWSHSAEDLFILAQALGPSITPTILYKRIFEILDDDEITNQALRLDTVTPPKSIKLYSDIPNEVNDELIPLSSLDLTAAEKLALRIAAYKKQVPTKKGAKGQYYFNLDDVNKYFKEGRRTPREKLVTLLENKR